MDPAGSCSSEFISVPIKNVLSDFAIQMVSGVRKSITSLHRLIALYVDTGLHVCALLSVKATFCGTSSTAHYLAAFGCYVDSQKFKAFQAAEAILYSVSQ